MERKEKRIWSHGMKEDMCRRFWLHFFRVVFYFELSTEKFKNIGVGIKLDFEETNGIEFNLNLYYIHFYFHIENIFPNTYTKEMVLNNDILGFKIIKLSFFEDVISWDFLNPSYMFDRYNCKNTINSGNIDWKDIVFGKLTITQTHDGEYDDVRLDIHDDEFYYGKISFSTIYHMRPRMKTKTFRRVEFEVPEGVPHPGKGTAAHNIDDDCTYSYSMPIPKNQSKMDSIIAVCQKFREGVLYCRKMYPL